LGADAHGLGGEHLAHEHRAVVVDTGRDRGPERRHPREERQPGKDMSPAALHQDPPTWCLRTRYGTPDRTGLKSTAPPAKSPKTWGERIRLRPEHSVAQIAQAHALDARLPGFCNDR